MVKFIKNIFFGVVLITLTDFALGNILSYYYFNVKSGGIYEANQSFTKTKSDILIFGSSRANHHYNPKIIESETNMSCYNTGRDGYFLPFYQTALLHSVLNRYTPKKIILDFGGSFTYSQKDLDRLSALMPYYENNKEIGHIIKLKSRFEAIKIYSKTYRFNSMLASIIKGNFFQDDSNKYNGYKPLLGQIDPEIIYSENIKQSNLNIDEDKLYILEEFFHLSKKNNIELFVVYSPFFEKLSSTHDETLEIVKLLSKKYSFEFIDFSSDDEFLGKNHLFKDKDHLNNIGSNMFTEKLMKIIAIGK